MVSLYIHPIYFKSTGELEILKENPLEWKKQIATVSIKKGMSINEYVQSKYGEKVSALINDITDITDVTDINKKKYKIKCASLVYGRHNSSSGWVRLLTCMNGSCAKFKFLLIHLK